MLQYYRQKAASAYRSSSSGSSGKTSTTTSSNQTSQGIDSNTADLVSVPKYGEITLADAERLAREGLLRRTGFDKNGKPTYIPTAKVPTQNIPMVR